MRGVSRLDRLVFDQVATARLRGAEPVLPRLSHAADHGRLWLGGATVLAAAGGRRGRRAAGRGVAALALASLATNTLVKCAVSRHRPLIDAVPTVRRPWRAPLTSSFPSGHAASAAAFTTGVALESRRAGALLAPVAATVAASRVYVGVHYPSDVVAGCLLGVGAGLLTAHWWPPRPQPAPLVHRTAPAPALPDGAGLCVVVNESAGGQFATPAQRLRELLPEAEIHEVTPAERATGTDGAAGPHPAPAPGPGPAPGSDPGDGPGADDGLLALLDAAADRAAGRGGALGVCGGDGTVNAAAVRAAARGLPLAVFPGGTLNHFAQDTGILTFEDTARAVYRGEAIPVDLGRARPPHGGGSPAGAGASPVYFLNNFGIGLYPELVRTRERLERRIGKWPAAAVALARVLRTSAPVRLEINGRPHRLWLLFVGNGRYAPEGFAPTHRTALDDGLLDVRTVDGDRPLARTRAVLAALTGTLARSPVCSTARVARLRLSGLDGVAAVSHDGETAAAPDALLVDKRQAGLTVYRPAPPGAAAPEGRVT